MFSQNKAQEISDTSSVFKPKNAHSSLRMIKSRHVVLINVCTHIRYKQEALSSWLGDHTAKNYSHATINFLLKRLDS